MLAVALLPGLGSTLSAQVCDPNDPCACSACCEYFVDGSFQCGVGQGGGYCFFTICEGGSDSNLGGESQCEFCCLANYTVQDWSQNGNCSIASPIRTHTSTQSGVAQLFYVRGCGGEYSLITLSVEG